MFSLQCDTISNRVISDESGSFFFPILIDKDERVVAGVVTIVFIPAFPRVDEFFVIAYRDV